MDDLWAGGVYVLVRIIIPGVIVAVWCHISHNQGITEGTAASGHLLIIFRIFVKNLRICCAPSYL